MQTFVKVLIWIGAFIVSVIAQMIADGIFQSVFTGYRMGWLLRLAFFGLMLFIGKKLSERWDLHCRGVNINIIDGKASAEGKSRKEYLIEHTPKFIINICEDGHTAAALDGLLQPHVKAGVITPKIAKALVEEFGNK